jgi:hypothetical protein
MDFIQVRPLLETNHISGPWVGAVYIGAKYVQFGSMEAGAELPANTTDVPPYAHVARLAPSSMEPS